MLGTLDFTGSEHWAPFNFSQSTALEMRLLLNVIDSMIPWYTHTLHHLHVEYSTSLLEFKSKLIFLKT